ncbi:hypothetical protein PVAP13_2NG440600 [Panicum virgatum]|uniref:Uncharacterized protein n=1 Tax=Panicum virgatum TaxID=38727 RepID=A0A8T0VNF5_PANVG|nr:hypothetical protein PVAP13_2NG440600 [Panicum virgatum]
MAAAGGAAAAPGRAGRRWFRARQSGPARSAKAVVALGVEAAAAQRREGPPASTALACVRPLPCSRSSGGEPHPPWPPTRGSYCRSRPSLRSASSQKTARTRRRPRPPPAPSTLAPHIPPSCSSDSRPWGLPGARSGRRRLVGCEASTAPATCCSGDGGRCSTRRVPGGGRRRAWPRGKRDSSGRVSIRAAASVCLRCVIFSPKHSYSGDLLQDIGFLDGRRWQPRTGPQPLSGWLAAEACAGVQ